MWPIQGVGIKRNRVELDGRKRQGQVGIQTVRGVSQRPDESCVNQHSFGRIVRDGIRLGDKLARVLRVAKACGGAALSFATSIFKCLAFKH